MSTIDECTHVDNTCIHHHYHTFAHLAHDTLPGNASVSEVALKAELTLVYDPAIFGPHSADDLVLPTFEPAFRKALTNHILGFRAEGLQIVAIDTEDLYPACVPDIIRALRQANRRHDPESPN